MKQNKNCVFCKIISGEIKSESVFSDSQILVLNDISPKAKNHLLIIPKEHLPQLDDASQEILGNLFKKTSDLAREIGIAKTGYRIIVNNGKNSGQEVSHLHIHLLGGQPLGPMICKGGGK